MLHATRRNPSKGDKGEGEVEASASLATAEKISVDAAV